MRRRPERCRQRQQRHRSQKQRRGEQGRRRRRTADTWWLFIVLHYFTAGSTPDVRDMSISPEQLPLKVGYDHATHLASPLHHPQPMVAAHALQSLRALHTAITVDSSPRASLQRSLSGGRATAPQLLHAPPVQLVLRASPHVIGPDLFCAGRKSMQLGLDRQREPGGGAHVTRHTPHVTRHTTHATRHTPHVTRHTSHVTRHTSHVTRHTSHATRHTPHVTRHTSHVTRHTTHATRHTSHVTRHTSHATRHTPHDTRHTSHVTRHTPHVTRRTPHVTRHKFHVHLSLKQPLSPEHEDPNTPLHRVIIIYHYNPKPLLTCNSCTRWCPWRCSAVHQAAASGDSSLSARMLRAKYSWFRVQLWSGGGGWGGGGFTVANEGCGGVTGGGGHDAGTTGRHALHRLDMRAQRQE
jgi:hypothetical protein